MSLETGPAIRCVGESYENAVYAVGIAENADGSGWCLIFASADEDDEQDVLLGQDTYSISTAEAATTFGGVRRCELSADRLELALAPEAALELGLPEHFSLPLDVDRQAYELLQTGLARVGVLS
jgi:hypothetical protein